MSPERHDVLYGPENDPEVSVGPDPGIIEEILRSCPERPEVVVVEALQVISGEVGDAQAARGVALDRRIRVRQQVLEPHPGAEEAVDGVLAGPLPVVMRVGVAQEHHAAHAGHHLRLVDLAAADVGEHVADAAPEREAEEHDGPVGVPLLFRRDQELVHVGAVPDAVAKDLRDLGSGIHAPRVVPNEAVSLVVRVEDIVDCALVTRNPPRRAVGLVFL